MRLDMPHVASPQSEVRAQALVSKAAWLRWAACLIGLVACIPRPVGQDGDLGFLVLTQRDPAGERVDRHRVVVSPLQVPDLAEVTPGATVYVEGHLARHGDRGRTSVIATRAWAILAAPPPPAPEDPTTHHARPASTCGRGTREAWR
jgi:hypothetical protein